MSRSGKTDAIAKAISEDLATLKEIKKQPRYSPELLSVVSSILYVGLLLGKYDQANFAQSTELAKDLLEITYDNYR